MTDGPEPPEGTSLPERAPGPEGAPGPDGAPGPESAPRSAGPRLGPGGEFDLIRRLADSPSSFPSDVLLGPGDDCAILDGGWVVSADLTVEGTHFLRDWISLEETGFRAAVAGLSDVAAMAAEPVGLLLTMALGSDQAWEEARRLQAGVDEACRQHGIRILGGDLTRTRGPLVLDVVALGRSGSPIRRDGLRPGDEIWVTGRLGGSGGAVAMWRRGEAPTESLRRAFARPKARVQEALWLRSHAPLHGLIDLSDGLAGDAGHLAAASEARIVMRAADIPVHPDVLRDFEVPSANDQTGAGEREEERSGWTSETEGVGNGGEALDASDLPPGLRLALGGGEDYELCLAVPPGSIDPVSEAFEVEFGLALTRVGTVTSGEGVFLEGIDGRVRPLDGGGFNHFAVDTVPLEGRRSRAESDPDQSSDPEHDRRPKP